MSLFSYQSALFCFSLFKISYFLELVKNFFHLFLLSGEEGIWTLAPLLTTYSLSRGAPSASLGTSPNMPDSKSIIYKFYHSFVSCKRRGWDSNPCALADKRFSRPPRYDHFDTSPWFSLQLSAFFLSAVLSSAVKIITLIPAYVNHFFEIFSRISKIS